jgi:hypothetical protein
MNQMAAFIRGRPVVELPFGGFRRGFGQIKTGVIGL